MGASKEAREARADFARTRHRLCSPHVSEAAGASDGVDLARLRSGRLARLRAQLRRSELAACVLVDPVNIRYATGARNMQIFHARNPARYLLVPA